MENDFEVMDTDLDYTAESLDDAIVDGSQEAVTQPEFEAEVTSTLSEEITATREPLQIFAQTTKNNNEFMETSTQTMTMIPTTQNVAPATVKVEEKKPIYKNPYAIGAGLLALYLMMNSDD